jgi:hypothetical protein
MENARQLQCKALRRLGKIRRRKNNGKQWKKTMRGAIETIGIWLDMHRRRAWVSETFARTASCP